MAKITQYKPDTEYAEDMEIILTAVQLTVSVILFSAPFLLYRRKGARMRKFYISMASDPENRKAFMLAIAVVAILFNFTIFALDGANLWQIPGLVLGFFLLRYKFTDAMLRWLHEDRVIQGIAFGLWLLSMSVPDLYGLSVSMGIVLSSAMFYPSRLILQQAEFSQAYLEFLLTDEDIANLYYLP